MTRAAARLVFNAKFASKPGQEPENLAARRLRRYYLQAVVRELLPDYRIADCLRSVVPLAGRVKLMASEKYHRGKYGNLVQCASVWTCPVCSSKITERRRVEIEEALTRLPWVAVMVTFTEQHTREDGLKELRDDLAAGMRRLKSGGWWKEFSQRWGIVGSISAVEVTYGLESGWHPHVHALYLVDADPNTEEIRDELSARFESIMAMSGRYVSPEFGVHVRATTHAAADYISKWSAAYEVTKATTKRGKGERYNPFELVQLYAEGEAWAGDRFREYAAAMKGVNQIRWSPKLRKLLDLGQEATDAELVDAPEEDVWKLIGYLSIRQWGVILKQDKRGELLEVLGTCDSSLVRAYLFALGITLES